MKNSSTFNGFLFIKLDAIGTKSEGPDYFLQQFDYTELHIVKNAHPWSIDPVLHPHVNTKVAITGTRHDAEITYSTIKHFMDKV